MEQSYALTVEQLLKRPLFQDAVLVGGARGLGRRVRWVHILELLEFEELIHGEEVILTTGLQLGDEETAVAFLEQLSHKRASCLCVELSPRFPVVSPNLKAAADRLELPLVAFPKTVRFVDITQDVHELLINAHYRLLKQLEHVSRQFHRMTLTSQGVGNVLKLLQSSLGEQIVYWPMDGQPLFAPPLGNAEQKAMTAAIARRLHARAEAEAEFRAAAGASADEWCEGDVRYIAQPVGAMEQTWATLVAALRRPAHETDYLLLDSASLSIAQDLLRNRFLEERKLYTETLWVDDLLHGRIREEDRLRSLLGAEFKRANETPYRVCLIEPENGETGAPPLQLSFTLREAFRRNGFQPLMTMKNGRLIVIAVDAHPKRTDGKLRLEKAFGSVFGVSLAGGGHAAADIGVGKTYVGLLNAGHSYQQAIHAIALGGAFQKPVMFFDDMGVFQLLFHIEDRSALRSFVNAYLGPILEHDLAKGSDLLRTLKVLLDHDGSKQIAAQQLFIARQSLYYRLEKIAELLGEHYMYPEHRLALQVAIRAHYFIQSERPESPASSL